MSAKNSLPRKPRKPHEQPWWRRLPSYNAVVAALAALIPVLVYYTGAVPKAIHAFGCWKNPQSHTSGKFVRADATAIYVELSNSGCENSYLREYALRLADLPVEDAAMEPTYADKAKIIIRPDKPVIIGLTARGLARKSENGKPVTDTAIDALLPSRNATVWILVNESNNQQQELQISVSANLIREFLHEKLPEVPVL
jgi:hypothetical protein